ncbi:hypothetical protein GCM10023322_60800 [Rugosimonospora acidiphila]|uniref:CopG family transcriptional regulator n=2 Tax=Rugosimonospora acidiphila TaxID=556531 RepID=A0ABP9SGU7_9ACTN
MGRGCPRFVGGTRGPYREVMYFTDRGIEELAQRRGDESVSVEWLAERLRDFVDLNPEFETPIERFATWLARLDDEDDDL